MSRLCFLDRNFFVYAILLGFYCNSIHPASRGVAAHTAGLFRSVRGAKGGVEYEEQSSTGELTYITAGFVNIFTFPPRGGSPS